MSYVERGLVKPGRALDLGCGPGRNARFLASRGFTVTAGGHFGLACFASGGMGSERSDADFYREPRLDGGLAYTGESLRAIFGDLTEVELRRMNDEPTGSACFGEPFLWTALFSR
ncbi:hypothetical protein Lesp02_16010 [Lentzea sp. NBRC 105346]|uniref:hypothetical protein n=1 Tax=Lentzea sp. NBRC 105346 TaxID=3032205 RepID=UPI0024A56A35|nr:hypothetical protein [Lentzea sp. NBRC 105346]GLZ29411.1 hypothetical protein Lesp02_16010 [Lentzea sp. NBRC 105346]